MENSTEKKRKFNIVDLIFILVIVALIAVVAVKFITNARAKTASSDFTVVIHSDDVPVTAVEGFKVGDKVQDDVGKEFGVITDIKTGEARVHYSDSEGHDVIGPKEDFVSIDITISCSGILNDHNLTVSGIKYNNNASYTFVCGMTKLWMRVTDIQPAAGVNG